MRKVKPYILIIVLIISLSVCACSKGGSTISENVEISFGDSYKVENEKLQKYDSLDWTSDNDNIATVSGGIIEGKGPGTAVITAKADDKVVATFTVKVVTVEVTQIVFSTNSKEMTVDEEFQLSYTLFPNNASDYGLEWKSADSNVASVDEEGKILALAPGQTTISVSNASGIVATCSITVINKPAYERLSEKERAFLDCFLAHVGQFKNVDSVVIKEVQFVSDNKWKVKVSAQNGFGGNGIEVYFLDEEAGGFWNYKSYDLDYDVDITPDSTYDVGLLNEAFAEKR